MKKSFLLAALLMALAGLARGGEDYPLGPDSQRQPGVPQGTVTKYTWTSQIFPGTVRDYWVYVPAQYTSDKPACVMVFQDGHSYVGEDGRARIPIVFDNLIAKHDMPVTIAIMIDPGVLKAASPGQQDRVNRSFEYDSLSDRYAQFLINEILPEVAKHYNLSTNPSDRAIAGASSGGICAFTVAWTHPEAFRRVLSFIGSFADLRGGDIYPALIRKTEPKSLRVFLQDGSHDLNLFAGDWWLANQSMASALTFAGYDVKFVTGDKDHDMIQGGAIMPDALRWLWRDYPQPITKAKMKPLGDPKTGFAGVDSEWELVSDQSKLWEPKVTVERRGPPHASAAGEVIFESVFSTPPNPTSGVAVDAQGNVFFSSDPVCEVVYRIDTSGQVSTYVKNANCARGIAIGPSGQLYACEDDGIMSYAPDGKKTVRAKNVTCNDLAATDKGCIYFTHREDATTTVGYLPSKGPARDVISSPAGDLYAHSSWADEGIRLSPDQSLLYVSGGAGKWVWSIHVQPDGSLRDWEPFYGVDAPDVPGALEVSSMAVDRQGLLFVATRLGIQVCDQQGRVVAILNPPENVEPAPGLITGIAIGGANFDYLYAAAGYQIFRRHLVRRGGQ